MQKVLAPFSFLLFLAVSCNNKPSESGEPSIPAIPVMHASVLASFPHDTTSYTEGLEFYRGQLYESAGEYGESQLRKEDLATGRVLKKIDLDKKYFGEGITIFHDHIYQLTYQEHVAFEYDTNFRVLKTFNLPTEGWGMTHDAKDLIMDDGSSRIYYRDPETFDTVRTINVSDNNGLVNNLNELEYIGGYLYANIWQTDNIVKIDPATGNIVGKADLSGLLQRAGKEVYDPNDVLNGIAYDSLTQKTYVTGKRWPLLFEVRFN